MYRQRIRQDIITYNAVISTRGKANEPAKGLLLLEVMQLQSLQGSEETELRRQGPREMVKAQVQNPQGSEETELRGQGPRELV